MRKALTWIIILVLLTNSVTALSMSNFWANLFGEPTAPEVLESYATLEEDRMHVVVRVKDSYGIKNASALAQSSNGEGFVPMALISAENGEYTFKAVVPVVGWTETSFVVTNLEDKTAYGFVTG